MKITYTCVSKLYIFKFVKYLFVNYVEVIVRNVEGIQKVLGLFPAFFSRLGLFPAGLFPVRSFPRRSFPRLHFPRHFVNKPNQNKPSQTKLKPNLL